MFDQQKIHELNELELVVYQYILENHVHIPALTIRELSKKCHVSTTTILRFCTKMGFNGFSELKYTLKKENATHLSVEHYYNATISVHSFLKKINEKSYVDMLKIAVNLIVAARHIVFTGIGTSGILGNYGYRYFANMGINSYSISDPFVPIPARGYEHTLAICLSVSGETVEVLKQASELKKAGATLLSITNNERSTLARLADYNLSYYMQEEYVQENTPAINITTQVPVIALLELLAHQASLLLTPTNH